MGRESAHRLSPLHSAVSAVMPRNILKPVCRRYEALVMFEGRGGQPLVILEDPLYYLKEERASPCKHDSLSREGSQKRDVCGAADARIAITLPCQGSPLSRARQNNIKWGACMGLVALRAATRTFATTSTDSRKSAHGTELHSGSSVCAKKKTRL